MKNYSRQREVILRTLAEHPVHPTAEELYRLVKKELPNIGLATVYRNLRDLADSGMIAPLPSVEKERFDGNVTPHAHFICEKCGKAKDVILPKALLDALREQNPNPFQLVYKGICDDCNKKIQNKKEI